MRWMSIGPQGKGTGQRARGGRQHGAGHLPVSFLLFPFALKRRGSGGVVAVGPVLTGTTRGSWGKSGGRGAKPGVPEPLASRPRQRAAWHVEGGSTDTSARA